MDPLMLSMNIHNTKTETSSSSKESFLPIKKRKRPLGDATNSFRVVAAVNTNPTAVKTVKKTTTASKYKGVVKHHNGTWGAQIYINHKRIWIGTFRSEAEAASAYDSVSIKLGKSDANSHRNIACSDQNVHEQEFQESYTIEAVLNMIKDGSYPHKFREFSKSRSQSFKKVSSKQSGEESTLLFQKELTPSDVGKLNRLVIPKKYAVKCLPCISHDRSEREEGEIREEVDEVEVVLYDRAMRQWKVRYCYWSSSQSFVFTRGWIGFVREKQLKEKDVVVFYTCNVKTLEGTSKNLLMIDVQYFSESGSVVTEEVNKTVGESSDPVQVRTGNVVSSKLEDKETKSKEKKGGIMLFGVMIQ